MASDTVPDFEESQWKHRQGNSPSCTAGVEGATPGVWGAGTSGQKSGEEAWNWGLSA